VNLKTFYFYFIK